MGLDFLKRPLPSRPGCYVVLVQVSGAVLVGARTLRALIGEGLYVYVGSGGGPGGIRARVSRHLRRRKPVRWHIDWLTSSGRARILGVAYCESGQCGWLGESVVAECLSGMGYKPVRGFGSTDDPRAESHLYRAPRGRDPSIVMADSLRCLEKAVGGRCGVVCF